MISLQQIFEQIKGTKVTQKLISTPLGVNKLKKTMGKRKKGQLNDQKGQNRAKQNMEEEKDEKRAKIGQKVFRSNTSH